MSSPLEQSEPTTNMPPAVHEIFQLLHNQVSLLHSNWRIFRQLFGTDEDRIRLLNRFAGVVFGTFQRVLYDGTILALGRLTDPAITMGRENLSLARLLEAVKAEGHAPLAAQMRCELDKLAANCAAMRALRNKRIAHSDLDTYLSPANGDDRLPGPSRADIEGALDGVRRLMNAVSLHYDSSQIAYEHLIVPLGVDGDALVGHLEDLARRLDAEPPHGRWRLQTPAQE
jgi:AbiU2